MHWGSVGSILHGGGWGVAVVSILHWGSDQFCIGVAVGSIVLGVCWINFAGGGGGWLLDQLYIEGMLDQLCNGGLLDQ